MNILCKIFWHRMYSDTDNVFGPSHCRRLKCEHTEPDLLCGREDYPPMPKSKNDIFEKLKDFYAQPLDGCWPLRPAWVPNLENPPKHVYRKIPTDSTGHYRKERITSFRRFTYEEFMQLLACKKENRL